MVFPMLSGFQSRQSSILSDIYIVFFLTLCSLLNCRCFGPKCGGCGEAIHYQDFVRKARDKVYHLRCFTCSVCSKQLSTGEVLYLQPGEDTLICKDDYLRTHQGKTPHQDTLDFSLAQWIRESNWSTRKSSKFWLRILLKTPNCF